jgi:hypothetical protein
VDAQVAPANVIRQDVHDVRFVGSDGRPADGEQSQDDECVSAHGKFSDWIMWSGLLPYGAFFLIKSIDFWANRSPSVLYPSTE